ncbi:MAG: aldose 1-epimerase [Steroidobacteraceae bacterium]
MIVERCFEAPRRRIHLQAGELHAEIWPEAGGAIARFDLHAGGTAPQPLFRPTPPQDLYSPLELASFPLLPYSNRIRDGHFAFGGAEYRLPRNFHGMKFPQHGVGWLLRWSTDAIETDTCELSLHHAAGTDWPFEFRATQRFTLTPEVLTIAMTLRNLTSTEMPYGMGQHPYFPRPRGTRLRARVAGVWRSDADMLPLQHAPLPDEWNLAQGILLDDTFIDNCFDGFGGEALIHWPDGSGLLIDAPPPLEFLVVYNPPAEQFFCVEPVTQLSDGFNMAARPGISAGNAGLRTLRSGESATVRHSFQYLRHAPQAAASPGC